MKPLARSFVTFGQDHTHSINGKKFDKDSVAMIRCKNAKEGRKKAFELFGQQFCFEYHEEQFNKVNLDYFPRGIIEV